MPSRMWIRWRRFAHRAAEIQSLAVLGALYWIVVVPIGLVRKAHARGSASEPQWLVRGRSRPVTLGEARRQG